MMNPNTKPNVGMHNPPHPGEILLAREQPVIERFARID